MTSGLCHFDLLSNSPFIFIVEMVKILVLVNRDLMDYRHLLEIDERTTHQ